jgi:hypothetical protein
MKPLKDQLEEGLPWLFSDLGFRVVSYSYDPAVFGNSVAVPDSAVFRLKFIREKGEIMVMVAPASGPEQWWNLKFVWEVLFGELPEPELEGYGPLIRRGFADLVDALGPKLARTKEELDRRSAERRRDIDRFLRQRPYRPTLLSRVRKTATGRVLTNWPGWIMLALFLWFIFHARGAS